MVPSLLNPTRRAAPDGAPAGAIGADRETTGGRVFGTIVARALIVLVVFPVIGHAIYTTVNWLLTRAVLPSLRVAEGWASVFDRGILGVTVLVAVVGAGSGCRRVWPTGPVRNK